MKTLGEWVRAQPLTREQAIGWLVRLSKGLLVLHELDVPYGRVTASCVTSVAPEPRARAVLVDADDVKQDFHFYSLERIERTGASKDDDVWALGVLLYHLVTGGYPFPGDSRRKVGERIKWRPASPIAVYGADFERIQSLLDRIFKADETLRLASLPLLVDALVALDPSTDALPPLELAVEVGEDIAWAPTPAAPKAPPSVQPKAERAEPEGTAKGGAPEDPPRAPPAPREPAATAPLELLPSRIAKTKAEKPPRIPLQSSDAVTETERPVDAPAARREARDPETTKAKGSGGTLWTLVGVLVGVGAVVYIQRTLDDDSSAAPLGDAGPEPSGSLRAPPWSTRPPPASARSVSSAPARAPTATPSAAASAAPSGAPSAAVPAGGDTDACLAAMFPPEAFGVGPPTFEGFCAEDDPVALADILRAAVVQGRPEPGAITGPMRLWSAMGWYRMAFAAAARHRCCAEPQPLSTPLGGKPCLFDPSLDALGKAAASGDAEALRSAMARYNTSVACLSTAPTSRTYGLNAPAEAGEATAFRVAVQHFRTSQP